MTLGEFVTITKALSDQLRVCAVLALQDGELCVCQIKTSRLAPSTISKHMSILKQAGIVGSRKGVYCFLVETETKPSVIDSIKLTIGFPD